MDFTRALIFPFDDDDSVTKVVVGTLAMLVGSVLWFIPAGYQVHVARNVIRGKKHPLPGTDELGEVMADGIMVLIASLVYMLPLILATCVLAAMGNVLGQSALGGVLFACLALCVGGILFIYLLVAGAIATMGTIRYCETGNFIEFLRIGVLWADVRAHLGTLVMLLIYLLVFDVIVLLLAPFSVIMCFVGVFFLSFYAVVVTGHLIGQAGVQILEVEEFSKFKRGI